MAKDLRISLLLDFYGQMLTDKQREVVELYYNEDLSLAEIAQHSQITRQGVRDSIKRAEHQLLECESRLGLLERFHTIRQGLDEIVLLTKEIQEENQRLLHSKALQRRADRIIAIAQWLGEEE